MNHFVQIWLDRSRFVGYGASAAKERRTEMPGATINAVDPECVGRPAAADIDRLVIAHDRLFSRRLLANAALDSAFREAWRFQILVFALHLHETRTIDDRRAGLTVGRLQALLAGRGIASPGRTAAILKQLEQAGYLIAAPSSIDKRVLLLSPSTELLDAIGLWEDAIFALIEMAASAGAPTARGPRRAGLGRAMRGEIVEARLVGWNPLLGFPMVTFFATRDGGWRLLSRLMAMASSIGGLAGQKTLRIDLDAFAGAAGGSRSTLRRLLEDAWQSGLLEAPPRNGRNIVPSIGLISEYRTWLSAFVDAHRGFAAAGANNCAGRIK